VLSRAADSTRQFLSVPLISVQRR